MNEIDVPLERRRFQRTAKITEEERTSLRGKLGELQWLQTTRPDVCASSSILQGEVNNAQVKDLMKVNGVIKSIKKDNDLEIVFKYIPLNKIMLVTYTDAGWGVRADDASQGGYITIAVNEDHIAHGLKMHFNVIDYASKKLKRKVKSSLGAEVQAFDEGLQQLMVARKMLSALTSKKVQRRDRGADLNDHIDDMVKKVPGAIVTDAKSLWDGVERRESFNAGLQDKRAGLEVVAIREQVQQQEVRTYWTNSDQQVADGLTKLAARARLVDWIRGGEINLRHDPSFTSAKKVRQQQRQSEDQDGPADLWFLSSWTREDRNCRCLRTVNNDGPVWSLVKYRTTVDMKTGEVLEDKVPVQEMNNDELYARLEPRRGLRTTFFHRRPGEIYMNRDNFEMLSEVSEERRRDLIIENLEKDIEHGQACLKEVIDHGQLDRAATFRQGLRLRRVHLQHYCDQRDGDDK